MPDRIENPFEKLGQESRCTKMTETKGGFSPSVREERVQHYLTGEGNHDSSDRIVLSVCVVLSKGFS